MEEQIYGIGNILNFSVQEKFIRWEEYEISIDSISVFSTGVSTNFHKKPKERGTLSKILFAGSAILSTAMQMSDEDTFSEIADTLIASMNLYGNDTDLPCMNLHLSNGMTFEITFTDLLTYRDKVKAVKNALNDNTKTTIIETIVTDSEISVTESEFNGEQFFIEEKEENMMNISNSTINGPVIENMSTAGLAQIREALTPELSSENQELANALNRLSDSIENGNRKETKKIATSIIKDVGSSTLTNVLSKSVIDFIKGLAEN